MPYKRYKGKVIRATLMFEVLHQLLVSIKLDDGSIYTSYTSSDTAEELLNNVKKLLSSADEKALDKLVGKAIIADVQGMEPNPWWSFSNERI